MLVTLVHQQKKIQRLQVQVVLVTKFYDQPKGEKDRHLLVLCYLSSFGTRYNKTIPAIKKITRNKIALRILPVT